jgi:hypothetical protein
MKLIRRLKIWWLRRYSRNMVRVPAGDIPEFLWDVLPEVFTPSDNVVITWQIKQGDLHISIHLIGEEE